MKLNNTKNSYKQARQQQRTGKYKNTSKHNIFTLSRKLTYYIHYRHTQETKGTNEHDKKEKKKKGTAISLKTSINTRRWPNWAETCCVILKLTVILKF
jgi:imidazoleglycerol phosphate dehydratase HisB